MLLLKKSLKKHTPKVRFQVKFKFLHKYINSVERLTKYSKVNKKNILGRWGVKYKKFNSKIELKPVGNLFNLVSPAYVQCLSNYRTRIKEYAIINSLFDNTLTCIVPSVQNYFPGFKLYSLKTLIWLKKIRKFVGQTVPLLWVPINMPVSYIYNSNNIKATYIKSSGVVGVRKRFDKHTKLINILLPSGQIKVFSILTYSIFSSILNLNIKKIIEGGWGYFSKNKKIRRVRGVAKNPVDHPNGGRTKAKQPELSPWGWVAKYNK